MSQGELRTLTFTLTDRTSARQTPRIPTRGEAAPDRPSPGPRACAEASDTKGKGHPLLTRQAHRQAWPCHRTGGGRESSSLLPAARPPLPSLPGSLTANCCCLSTRTPHPRPPPQAPFSEASSHMGSCPPNHSTGQGAQQFSVLLGDTPGGPWGHPSSVGSKLCDGCCQVSTPAPLGHRPASRGQLSPGCPLKAPGASWLPRRCHRRPGRRATAPGKPTARHSRGTACWLCPQEEPAP